MALLKPSKCEIKAKHPYWTRKILLRIFPRLGEMERN